MTIAMSRRWRRLAWFVIGCAGTALFVAVLYALLQGAQYARSSADTTDAIRQTQVSNHVLLNTIQDCTQPSGECYKRGQKRTADAVGDINRVIILAAACASGLPQGMTVSERQNQIQSCVIERLSVREH